jgi:hypothetical protein
MDHFLLTTAFLSASLKPSTRVLPSGRAGFKGRHRMDWVIEYLLICTVAIAPHPHGNAPSTGLKIYGSYPSEKQCMRGAAFDRATCVCIPTPHPVEEKK